MGYLLGRDELFWRLGHEQSDALLNELKALENVNVQDEIGLSYLWVACSSHYLEAVILLLEKGADPNHTDNQGHETILAALGRRNEHNPAILEAFLRHGLDLNRIKGGMPLKEWILSFEDEKLNDVIRKFEEGKA